MSLRSVEICAGGGGQALGLEQAGFEHQAVIEIDPHAVNTLLTNRPGWKISQADIRDVPGRQFEDIDLLAGGPPCQPFSVGGKQLGEADERDLFPEALRLAREIQPRAIMLENVAGLAQARFAGYRQYMVFALHSMGYATWWQTERAEWHGVPQIRPRMVLIALRAPWAARFHWPTYHTAPRTAGVTLWDMMASRGWSGAATWALDRCNRVAPTIVGGSRKHGGPDLGPTRARAEWRAMGVNGSSIAEEPPGIEEPCDHLPRLTVAMVALLQGFPDDWVFSGKKTAAYRQVGQAFPPPVAKDLGTAIREALT